MVNCSALDCWSLISGDQQFLPLSNQGMRLFGETALALQIHHRDSLVNHVLDFTKISRKAP